MKKKEKLKDNIKLENLRSSLFQNEDLNLYPNIFNKPYATVNKSGCIVDQVDPGSLRDIHNGIKCDFNVYKYPIDCPV